MSDADWRVQVRLSARAAAWLAGRADRMHAGSHHQQARSELELWQSVMHGELRRIRLTLAQACCIADVCNGWAMSPVILAGTGLVYAECCDAFRLARAAPVPGESSYGAKHGIDEQQLLDYLQTLGPAADHALQDAIARWWAEDLPMTAEGFGQAGLRIAPGTI